MMGDDFLQPIEQALDEEGLYWSREDDDQALRLSFKSEGDRYFVVAYRDDPTFLMFGSGWSLPANIPLGAALRIANVLNVRKKFVKTALWEDERDVLFTIELCLADFDEFGEHFARLLDALRSTISEFFGELHAADHPSE
ncbi:MAG: YbjN domain-containing protein [Vulcanimicrobiaceae bacterium]